MKQAGNKEEGFWQGKVARIASYLGWRKTVAACCWVGLFGTLGGGTALYAQPPGSNPSGPIALTIARTRALAQAEKDKPKVEAPPEKLDLPVPRPVDPFGPSKLRLPTLPDTPGAVCPPGGVGAPGGGLPGTASGPTPEDLTDFKRYIADYVSPRNSIDIVAGQFRLMVLKEAPKRVQIGDENTASYTLINPTTLSLLGRTRGTTALNLWFPDPADKNKDKILSLLIRVVPDPESRLRLERAYKALEKEINCAFPDSRVCISLVGEKIVLSGQAKDIAEATQILRVVQANAPTPPGSPRGSRPAAGGVPGPNEVPGPGNITPVGLRPGEQLAGDPADIINLLRVPGEQQVMLRVTVAEVNRAAARSIGINFNILNNQGVVVFGQNTGSLFLGGLGGLGFGGGATTAGGFGANLANLVLNLDGGQVPIAINALRNLNYARSLAEPTLTALNGQTASFQAGGSFPVPVTTGTTLNGLQGVQFIPFGVQLSFTPYITDKDRIRLSIASVVSTRDLTATTLIGGAAVPGLNTRNFQTTVELREGQTLMVAGLIQTNLGSDATRVPFFGDLPVIGKLAGFDRIASGEQELVVLVTPELVHPLEPKEICPLPGSDLFEPGDLEFYLLGRLESRRNYDYRSPVRTDFQRMSSYRHCENLYIFGQHGYSDMPLQVKP